MRKLRPDYLARSLSGVNIKILAGQGMQTLLLDLDNTLAPWRTKDFSASVLNWLNEAKQSFDIYIFSNGSPERVADAARTLGIKYIAGAHKPDGKKIQKVLSEKQINPETAVIIGDQLYTDVLSAVRLGMRSVLITPIPGREYIFTKFNRLRERLPRRRINKSMKYMEDIYD